MTFVDAFFLGLQLTANPNKVYKKGWHDALSGNPRYQFRLAFLFEFYRRTPKQYDKGYDDGFKERLIRKI